MNESPEVFLAKHGILFGEENELVPAGINLLWRTPTTGDCSTEIKKPFCVLEKKNPFFF